MLTYIRTHRSWLFFTAIVLMLFVVITPLRVGAAPGADGNLTVTAANTVLNRYSTATAITGNVITVSNISDLNDGSGHYANNTLSAGDMILIYQAQGAAFTDVSESAAYGAFSYNNAGHYEFAAVSSVSGNDITIDSSNNAPYSCSGIGTYTLPVQVVRVPQYTNLTINSGASVVANGWDGSTGGVVALVVQETTTVNGSIDVSGQGFRGGAVDNAAFFPYTGTGYRNGDSRVGGTKGEGVLGYVTEYDANNGRYGRGAPANGGGGGVAHNSAGGGGANGDNGGTWTGGGSPDLSTSSWSSAWDIDDGTNDGSIPAYFLNGAGGGRGGYDYATSDQDALIVSPGNTAWGGNYRRQDGGLGGRPVANDPDSRVFLGGGGGAGDGNNNNSGPGGRGGGLVILGLHNLAGSGQIIANGADGGNAGSSDAAGGAGAGGSVIIQANTVSGVSVSADGGSGGNQPATGQVEGPGGGGGGGFIAVDATNGSLTTSTAGGANGTTASSLVTEFIPNGATQGYAGATATTDFTFPGCSTPTAVSLQSFSAASQPISLIALLLVVLLLAFGSVWLLRRGR